jgi:hypothetical protein
MSEFTFLSLLLPELISRVTDFAFAQTQEAKENHKDKRDLKLVLNHVFDDCIESENPPDLIIACLANPAFSKALEGILAGEPMDLRKIDDCISETQKLPINRETVDLYIKYSKKYKGHEEQLSGRWEKRIKEDNYYLFKAIVSDTERCYHALTTQRVNSSDYAKLRNQIARTQEGVNTLLSMSHATFTFLITFVALLYGFDFIDKISDYGFRIYSDFIANTIYGMTSTATGTLAFLVKKRKLTPSEMPPPSAPPITKIDL